MAHRVTRHLRLLRPLKCFLTALRNHQQVSELYLYDALNLLSCMTLDVKDIQFIVLHHKDKLFTVLNYSRNLENAAKGGLKRTAHWAPCYFRNPNSWYPVLERATIPSAISAIQPLLPVLMVPQSIRTEEGLSVNICCSSASALCQTGNNDGKSWSSPVVPLSERNLKGRTGQPGTLSLRGAARKQRETRRRRRLEYDSPSDDSDIPSLEREADFPLGRGSSFVRSVRCNSRIVFSLFFFISLNIES